MDVREFASYQRQSRKTWGLVRTDHPIVYPTLGLANEAGEVAGKIKKLFRDKDGRIGDADRMTGARPVRVQAVGARLSAEIARDMYNYGQLPVTFDDGSVGW